jgi:hemoglobin-like flavoprotein
MSGDTIDAKVPRDREVRMAVSAEDMAIVRETLPLVEAQIGPLSERFYGNLFAVAPGMRKLFRDDLEGQGMRFVTTLTTIVALLDDRAAFEEAVDRLAEAHRMVGVRREHFVPLGCALMVTLGETLGPAFTERRQQAWRAAYDHVAARMMVRT